MSASKRLRSLQVTAFEVGFTRAMRGDGLDDPVDVVAEKIPLIGRRDYAPASAACERGFEAGLKFLIALGGRAAAREALADGERLRVAAHESWRQLQAVVGPGVQFPLEPCADCELIGGCARTGWACEEFRWYVSRNGGRGVRPRRVPDSPYDFGAI